MHPFSKNQAGKHRGRKLGEGVNYTDTTMVEAGWGKGGIKLGSLTLPSFYIKYIYIYFFLNKQTKEVNYKTFLVQKLLTSLCLSFLACKMGF